MTCFPTANHLASWAGTTPGNNESAGKVKSSRTRPGNPYLQGALGAAAVSVAQTQTYLGARYRRTASRRGAMKANVAVQHTMLVIIWHMLTSGALYQDLGSDYYSKLRPGRAKNRAVAQLEALGFTVALTTILDESHRGSA